MRKLILYSVIASLGFFLGGCNSDIFVEPAPDIPERVNLNGFNGVERLLIPRKGLRDISFDDNYDPNWDLHTIYYGQDGEELVSHTDISQVSKILYWSYRFAIELNLKGEEVEIVALDNAYPSELEVFLKFDYRHTVKMMTLNIGVGKPHDIIELNPTIDNPVSGSKTEKVGLPVNFHNNSSLTQKMAVYPYQEAKSKLCLIADEFWSEGSVGKISTPCYIDGEWSPFLADEVEATIGKTTEFISSNVDAGEVAYVEVPPYTSMRVEVYVVYATLNTDYFGLIQLPNTELGWMIEGKYELLQPIDYKIETTKLEL